MAIYQHFFLILAPPLPELCLTNFRGGRRIVMLNAEELHLLSLSFVLSNRITSTCLLSSMSLLSGSLINFYLLNPTTQWTIIISSHSYADGDWPTEKLNILFNVIQKIWWRNSAGIPESSLWMFVLAWMSLRAKLASKNWIIVLPLPRYLFKYFLKWKNWTLYFNF